MRCLSSSRTAPHQKMCGLHLTPSPITALRPAALGRRYPSALDIGGEILAILSRGLYTNPLDCIREYVQNAVDASASAVRIKLTGNSLLIFDDGHGMSFSDILLARQFGLSPKFRDRHAGF